MFGHSFFLIKKKVFVSFIFLFLFPFFVSGQGLKGSLQGVVVDAETGSPLIGVTVIVRGISPILGTTTDVNGEFLFSKVSVGRHSLDFSYIGYEPYSTNNTEIKVKNYTYLTVKLSESFEKLDEVVISAETSEEKRSGLNKMATVSTLSIDVETTNKFAGSLSDPARMVASYAGVSQAGDQRNDIVVRGNSPLNVLWRIEGANIFNPNHFAAAGSTGGAISILNNNLLSKSDFFTSAFVAEYGNALSGVFDLNLRDGNREKHAFLGQIGFNGVEFSAEGPLQKEKRSSFLAAYRHSFFDIFDALKIDLGIGAKPIYKDLTFKLSFPSLKYGKIDVWGILGDSKINVIGIRDDFEKTGITTEIEKDTNLYFSSSTSIVGISHSYFFKNKNQLKTSLTYNLKTSKTQADSLFSRDPFQTKRSYDENSQENKLGLGVKYFGKKSTKMSYLFGAYVDLLGLKYLEKASNGILFSDEFTIKRNTKENGVLFLQPFAQVKQKLNENFFFTVGLSSSYFSYNNSLSLEPRIGGNYKTSARNTLNFGYGLHSKTQPLYAHLVATPNNNGGSTLTNKELGFTKSHHFVLGNKFSLTKNISLKTEAYYQNLFDIPVERKESAYSFINDGIGFNLVTPDSLINNGTGKNYGIEVTLEKYLTKNYYFLFSGTLFQSKYTPSDGIERNTTFNAEYVMNFLGGIELPLIENIKTKMSFISDFKITSTGGKRGDGEVDLSASSAKKEVVYVTGSEFRDFLMPYFRADLKVGVKVDTKRITQTFEFQANNITNRRNIFTREYDPGSQSWQETYQLEFFPVGVYRVQF